MKPCLRNLARLGGSRPLHACAFYAGVFSAVLSCAGRFPDQGTDADLELTAGRFARGGLPDPDDGPAILGTFLNRTQLLPGQRSLSVSGVAAPEATSVLVMLEGDVGYYRIDVEFPPPEVPDSVGFSTELSLRRQRSEGSYLLQFQALDERGRAGDVVTRPLRVAAPGESDPDLLVTLSFHGLADLDLHLLLPDGGEIFAEDPVHSVEDHPIAYLEADTNANCRYDGQGQERVIFATPPPPGEYHVRVETGSLCGEASSPYKVEVNRRGVVVGDGEGLALPTDLRFGEGRGAGREILSFWVEP